MSFEHGNALSAAACHWNSEVLSIPLLLVFHKLMLMVKPRTVVYLVYTYELDLE